MTLIAGAMQFLNAARLAVKTGTAPSIPTVLDSSATSSILDAGKSDYFNVGGFGLSANARKLNEQMFNNSYVNELFSYAAGTDSTAEGSATIIKGLRARLPQSMIRPDLLVEPEEEEGADNGNAAASQNGQIVDEEA